MTYRDNVKAIIETNFIGLSEEYIEGVCAKICEIQSDKTYEDGLNDAWECARKVLVVESEGGLPLGEQLEIFDHTLPVEVLKKYTASEAIAKIKEYEEQEKEMRENCSILNDTCPYDIPCAECEVHCSVERAKQKLKGDKE